MNYIDVLERKLSNVDSKICNLIDDYKSFEDTDRLADYIIQFLRTYVEHVAARLYAYEHHDEEVVIKNKDHSMTKYNNVFSSKNEYRFLKELLDSLQITVSHFVPEGDGAKRLMAMYLPKLYQLRTLMGDKFGMELLHNLDEYPREQEELLSDFYKQVYNRISNLNSRDASEHASARYYIVGKHYKNIAGKGLFEYNLSYARGRRNKFERFVVYSTIDIPDNYAIMCDFAHSSIVYNGIEIELKVIVSWTVSIRPCELEKLVELCGFKIEVKSRDAFYDELMRFLTITGLHLLDFITADENAYVLYKVNSGIERHEELNETFDICRKIVLEEKKGANVLRYLFCFLRNDVIKDQIGDRKNNYLSFLNLRNEAIPFDDNPYATSLSDHNVKTGQLMRCINIQGCERQIVADMVNKAAFDSNMLYVEVESELEDYYDFLIDQFNKSLYISHKQQARRIERFNNYFYVRKYFEDTRAIIEGLQNYTLEGVGDYSEMVERFLASDTVIDDDLKRRLIVNAFVGSKVALVYGAAGTGKTRIIEYISEVFTGKRILYLANTNAAKENIEKRVPGASRCYTVYDYINNRPNIRYDLIVIDECSTVCNKHFLAVLTGSDTDAFLLVGDVYQIESIEFGNWFNFARYFIDKKSVYELTTPFRAKDEKKLLAAWDCVRNFDINMFERLQNEGFISSLDETLYDQDEDEIVLCLGYDGVYGINNVNRYLQNKNISAPVYWENWIYKVGDQILFNEDRRFENILHNNLKGWIRAIEKADDHITFEIIVDKEISKLEASLAEIELLDCAEKGKSCVRFSVNKHIERDNEDENKDKKEFVPFQVAYAVSIHKSQGLEYDSVKVIITEDIDEKISHNIFYTAITRARKKLKIYMSVESQAKLADRFVKSNVGLKQAQIFAGHTGLKLKNTVS